MEKAYIYCRYTDYDGMSCVGFKNEHLAIAYCFKELKILTSGIVTKKPLQKEPKSIHLMNKMIKEYEFSLPEINRSIIHELTYQNVIVGKD